MIGNTWKKNKKNCLFSGKLFAFCCSQRTPSKALYFTDLLLLRQFYGRSNSSIFSTANKALFLSTQSFTNRTVNVGNYPFESPVDLTLHASAPGNASLVTGHNLKKRFDIYYLYICIIATLTLFSVAQLATFLFHFISRQPRTRCDAVAIEGPTEFPVFTLSQASLICKGKHYLLHDSAQT